MLKQKLSTLFAFVLALNVAAVAQAGEKKAEAKADPKVMVVKFHADWCGGCKMLQPKLDKVKKEVDKKDVSFVQLDQTDDKTTAKAEKAMKALGLDKVWEKYAGQTGFALLIDAKTKKIITSFKYKADTKDMVKTINKALKNA